MIFKEAGAGPALRLFFDFPEELYKTNPYYRATDEDICGLVVRGPTAYHTHAELAPYLIYDGEEAVGRVCLIADQKLPEHVQAAFFEAKPGRVNLTAGIMEIARKRFPLRKKIVFGLNGHLNYSAGFLMNRHAEIPLFGLPYTNDYREYFGSLKCRSMFTFKYPLQAFFDYCKKKTEDFRTAGLKSGFLTRKD